MYKNDDDREGKEMLDVKNLSYGERSQLAENPDTPAGTLAELAEAEEVWVRQMIAWNSNTPYETLVALANDEELFVRSSVAENRNTPVGTLTQLAGDSEEQVRRYVAENDSTPVETLVSLASDAELTVRRMVVSHLKRSSSKFREFVIARDGLSPEEAEQVRVLPDTFLLSMYEETVATV